MQEELGGPYGEEREYCWETSLKLCSRNLSSKPRCRRRIFFLWINYIPQSTLEIYLAPIFASSTLPHVEKIIVRWSITILMEVTIVTFQCWIWHKWWTIVVFIRFYGISDFKRQHQTWHKLCKLWPQHLTPTLGMHQFGTPISSSVSHILQIKAYQTHTQNSFQSRSCLVFLLTMSAHWIQMCQNTCFCGFLLLSITYRYSYIYSSMLGAIRFDYVSSFFVNQTRYKKWNFLKII